MKKILKMASAASLLGAMLVVSGCGGGGDGYYATPLTPAPVATPLISADGSVTNGGASIDTTYRFAAGTFKFNIANFGAGDVLSFANVAGSEVTVFNAIYGDGKVQVLWSNNAASQTVTVELTGLTDAQDSALNNVADFTTVFRAGTITTQLL